MKLNIYGKNAEGKRVVVKTYEAESADLCFGVVEDIIDLLGNVDLDNSADLFKVVKPALNILKPVLLDVFEGLTEEELRNTKVKELIGVLVELLALVMAELGDTFGSEEKN